MALNGYIETGAFQATDGTRTLVLEWSASQSGPAENYSNVSWVLRGGGTSKQGINAKNIQAQIHTHHTGILWTSATKLYNGTVIASGTVQVPHNADGTASFYTGVSGYIYNYGTNYEKTASQTWNLNTINRYFWNDINAYHPDGVTQKGAKFNLKYSDEGSTRYDLTNEPEPALYKLYGTIITISNIRPIHEYYKVTGVSGATNIGNGTYQKTVTDGSIIEIRTAYQEYLLTITPNGGYRVEDNNTDVITVTKTYGATEDIRERRRNNYTLVGYTVANSSNGSTTDLGGATFSFDNNTKIGTFKQGSVPCTLIPQWTPNTYTITFNGNGGTTVIDSLSIAYETEQNNDISRYTPIRQAYEFLGWYTSPVGGVQVYDANGLCTNEGTYWFDNVCVYTSDYNLFAQWKIKANCYNKNNGVYKIGMMYKRINGEYKTGLVKLRKNGSYTDSSM